MGFLDNFSNEFGKKTGKALGNKLYGRHADDLRVGSNKNLNANINHGQARSARAWHEEDEEMDDDKIEIMKQEQETKFLESMMNIEFNCNNKDEIVKTLTTLSSYVDMWLKESSKNANVARSKFDVGLAMLNSIAPQDPMVAFFVNKKSTWETFDKQRKTMYMYIGIGVIVLAIIAAIVITLNADYIFY
ncbi:MULTISPECIES: hypothetical protein [Butyricimonas]|uniref:hypothetical protein n=1 Tax=Butyricimonas TaxID=574697 RepID=UPI001D060EF6|nr:MULTISPECIES: hypothetical protein [Butyricimonas]MCB6970754.1 hypothetical protein [Butyricimonas synergistica]MCG4517468.1 hypothetical protein [Butyricimonas sp. DFI.6.44]